jgi:hypothetical protein
VPAAGATALGSVLPALAARTVMLASLIGVAVAEARQLRGRERRVLPAQRPWPGPESSGPSHSCIVSSRRRVL